MSKFLEYDPFSGMAHYTEDGDGDDITVHSSQDVQPYLDWATEIRNSGVADKGIKNELWKYCTVPNHVYLEMKKKGIDMYNKNHSKAFLKEINENYPHLKYTRLHHE